MSKEEINEYQKRYRELHKKERKEYDKLYREKNLNELKSKSRTRSKKHYEKNKKEINQRHKKYDVENKEARKKYFKDYKKKKMLNDPLFKLEKNIRNSIRQSFKRTNFRKNNKTEIILGCSFEEFKSHLESKFESWMNFNNHGKYNGEKNFGWDIDHIIPVSNAKTEEELIKLNHYTNLQPLCSYTNRDIKKNKLIINNLN